MKVSRSTLLGHRIENAKEFILNILSTSNKDHVEAPDIYVDTNYKTGEKYLMFSDGIHRAKAFEELGFDEILIEIDKTDVREIKKIIEDERIHKNI